MRDSRFNIIAQKWCEDHNNMCDLYLDDLRKVDKYFYQYFEEKKWSS